MRLAPVLVLSFLGIVAEAKPKPSPLKDHVAIKVKSGSAEPPVRGQCIDLWEPVCGSDGKTYGNECELKEEARLNQPNLTIAHEGECRRKEPPVRVQCIDLWEPVCGSDGKTYGNECELKEEARLNQPNLTIAHEGECRREKDCPEQCNFIYRPVCGSDGKTYSNGCALRQTSCQSKHDLNMAYRGRCNPDKGD